MDDSTEDLKSYQSLGNPFWRSINRMKLIMRYTKLQGFRDLMRLNYFEGPSSFHQYFNSRLRVFTNLAIPKEIFYMLGVDVVFVEQIAAVAATSPENREMIGRARSVVPSSTYCSFHQAALGVFEAGAIPPPRLFVAPSFVCEETVTLYAYLGKKFNSPVLYLDCPHDTDAAAEQYVAEQLKAITLEMADYFNLKLTEENIRNTLRYTNEARDWWIRYQDVRKQLYEDSVAITFQTLILSTTLYSKYGLPQTVDIVRKCYEELKSKMEAMVDRGGRKSPRILWMHLVPYHTSALLSMFGNIRANIVSDELSYCIWEEMDLEDPWLGLARRIMNNAFYGGLSRRLARLEDLIAKNDIQAVIELTHPGCKAGCALSNIVKTFLKDRNIPHLAIEADLIDPDNFSGEQIRIRIEAFIEMINQL